MRILRALVLIYILLVGTYWSLNLPMANCETQDLGFFLNLTVTFRNDGIKTWNLTQEDRSWGLFMNNSWQTVRLVEYAYPLERTTVDNDGNSIAIFQFRSELEPGESLTDHVTYYIRSKPRHIPYLSVDQSETLDEIPEDLRERYCKGGGFWMIHDQQIQDTAHNIAGNETNVLMIVENLVAWMWTNVEYKSHDPTFYPNQTLFHREGDCDEQAILFGTFCRILGIPVHLQLGCIYLEGYDDESTSAQNHITYKANQVGWHGWAVVYIPPWGWLPVDLTFVLGSQNDALNAIRTNAVTLQYTIQAYNISETDHLASDRAYGDFLQENNFHIDLIHDMRQADVFQGDINCDGKVDILDLSKVALAFESKPGYENWNQLADLDKNGVINIADIAQVAKEFGKMA